jgi:hypothetical protein
LSRSLADAILSTGDIAQARFTLPHAVAWAGSQWLAHTGAIRGRYAQSSPPE